ncbi:growth-regulating factor 2 isoform X2 [Humulus lupulus]|uniref:growth-regulating factor 2 isoform X2 n=1 Tax=Humulus lupulus TaxID=3486 RepID=UPI002B41680E|nr:growth-regulating factor 2 isoform X2 [Humulus lupulus]
MDNFGVSDKKEEAIENNNNNNNTNIKACTNSSHVLGLGVELQSRESLPNKSMRMMMMTKMMMLDHHQTQANHNRLFQSSQIGVSDGPTTTTAPTNSNSTTTPTPKTNDYNNIYGLVGSSPVVFGAGAAVKSPLQQPFNTYCSSSSSSSITTTATPAAAAPVSYTTALRSPGGVMAASVGFPFTNAQLKELERQAMIFKYMVAAVPVPLDLLLPFNRTMTGSAIPIHYPYAEPGRCKRTDGKKWRCSRDVAPDQKYCERHMHRGRPRSRKHVEVQVNNNIHNNNNSNSSKRTRHDNQQQTLLASSSASLATSTVTNPQCHQSHFLGSSTTALPYHPSPVFMDKPVFESMPSLSADKEARSMEWMMKGEAVTMAASDPRWLHLMQSKMELPSKSSFCDNNSSSIFSQQEEPFLNLNSYGSFGTGEVEQDRECALFLNPEDVSLDNQQTNSDTPRSFIDAWSKTNMGETMAHSCSSVNQSSVSSQGKLSPSSLTLSMGGYGSMNDEMGRTQIGSGFNGSDDTKPHVSSWLTPASWATAASPPGGPLAEVLRSSSLTATTSAASDPSSPFPGNGDSGSPPATAVSSPSGVLQKTVTSLSDSSGCSSPGPGSSKVKAEIALL